DVEDSEDLGAVAGHLPVADLPPAQDAVAVDNERGAIGHVAVLVVHAIGPDHRPVDVAQEREGELPGRGDGLVAESAVAADADEPRAPLADLPGDLIQAAELGRSDAAEVVAVEREDGVTPSELFELDGTAER